MLKRNVKSTIKKNLSMFNFSKFKIIFGVDYIEIFCWVRKEVTVDEIYLKDTIRDLIYNIHFSYIGNLEDFSKEMQIYVGVYKEGTRKPRQRKSKNPRNWTFF